jgi:hypothetical protein
MFLVLISGAFEAACVLCCQVEGCLWWQIGETLMQFLFMGLFHNS